MDLENLDVIELLEKKQNYHLEQIKRIKKALSALKGEAGTEKATSTGQTKIPWTEKVMDLFGKSGEEMSQETIRQRLAESGIPEALDEKNRQTIYSTLSRGVKSGKLEKVGYGLYRKRRRQRIFTENDVRNKNEGSEPSNRSEPS